MSQRWWGVLAPVAMAGLAVFVVAVTSPTAPVAQGIRWGLLLALVQSFGSTAAYLGAWRTRFFYWIWGFCVLFRMVFFAVTAVVVYRFMSMSFVAVMTTMVVATTVFLVVESATLLKG